MNVFKHSRTEVRDTNSTELFNFLKFEMIKKLFLLAFATLILQSLSAQMLFSYDFAADTIGRPLNGRNGWSNSTATGFPGIGASVGTEGPSKETRSVTQVFTQV